MTTTIPWFTRPDWQQVMRQAPVLSLVESFARDGYVVLDVPSCSAEVVQAIQSALQTQLGPGKRVQHAWRNVPEAQQLAGDKTVMDFLKHAYQREPIPFQTLHFSHGTQQSTHSDTLHFHTLPPRWMCGVWIALEDVDEHNGPLHVYPGSHRLPIWELHDFGIEPTVEAHEEYEQLLAQWIEQQQLTKKVLSVQQGQAVIWAANLLHGGEPIVDSNRTRWSQVTHYVFDHTLTYAPRRSDMYQGKLFLLPVEDVRTRTQVPQYLNGKQYKPSGQQQFWLRPSLSSFVRAVWSRAVSTLHK